MPDSGFIKIRGARQHNLQNIDVDIPRNALVVFTGVSGSGKSSLAFGTVFAEAQRRYFESIAPYARRLMAQLPAPRVGEISGLPPAVALQQKRGEPTVRSSVGTITKLSNSLRMLFSRAGTYPTGTTGRLDSDAFSANTLAGACPVCHGIGIVHSVSETSLVPDPNLSIRQRAVAAWPGAWQGKNYQDILATLGYDVESPWHTLAKKDRDWILFTEEKPVVTVHAIREAHRIQRPYQGTYMSAASYVRHTFSTTQSATLRKRVAQFMDKAPCLECAGKRLQTAALAVSFGGYDIADMGHMPLAQLTNALKSAAELAQEEKQEVARLIVDDLCERIDILSKLGLDYLSLDRVTPTLSSGELQRLRLATQLKSGLFGVVYVLDEPSAGLHPADSESLITTLRSLKDAGNSLFVVEHELDVVRQADWIVDIGPAAGEAGGKLIYSGPVAGLADVAESVTGRYLFNDHCKDRPVERKESAKAKKDSQVFATDQEWLRLADVSKHNLKNLSVAFPLGALTAVTGVSGSGKSTLVSQVLADTFSAALGTAKTNDEEDDEDGKESARESSEKNSARDVEADIDLEGIDTLARVTGQATIESGLDKIRRIVAVDQKPIGRTPRSNLATYTGLFDFVRKAFAATPAAKAKKYNAGRFSFNVSGGRCETCEGEGFINVELMFLPSVYTPCTTCHGTRYNTETLEIKYRDRSIADILDMTVDSASEFFDEMAPVKRALATLRQVGLGYLRLGQPATELSGGEAQRIRLATELQREQRGDTLYLLDEPTTGMHPADVEKLMTQLRALVAAGNTVIVVEHDMDVIAGADHVIDLGPGAGVDGGQIIATGTPAVVAQAKASRTAPYLARRLASRGHEKQASR
ncbi:MAG: excinuclease ABC subunit UvrA [Cyanobacteria bacterium REEB67]|nr:excinuclease ABC subunit UvrA [Cyanobacteria bacterium REEB67]